MKLATIFALFAMLAFGLAGQSQAGSLQTGIAQDAMCAAPAPAIASPNCTASASLTNVSWRKHFDRTVSGQGTVVWDRCPPGSDKFCPAGAYCCQNSAGDYRCCK